MGKAKELQAVLKYFDESMKASNSLHIQTALEKFSMFSEHRDFGSASADIFWRFLSSIKRNQEKIAYSALYRPSETEIYRKRLYTSTKMFNQALPLLKVDDYNKEQAEGYIRKHELGVSTRVKDFVKNKTSNGERYYSTGQRIKQIYEFYKQTEQYKPEEIKKKTQELFDLLTDSDVDVRHTHFSPMYDLLTRAAKHRPQNIQLKLFETSLPQQKTMDKELLKTIVKVYVDSLMKKKEPHEFNMSAMQKFGLMLKAAVRKNSFSRDEVKELAKILKTHPFRTTLAEKHLNKMADDLVETYDAKESKEINKLLDWQKKAPRKRMIEKAAQENVVIAGLYQKLVLEQDIGRINLEQKYQEEKGALGQSIVAEYQKISNKNKAQQNVLKQNHQKNQETFAIIERKLKLIGPKRSFYFQIINDAIAKGYIAKPKLEHPYQKDGYEL